MSARWVAILRQLFGTKTWIRPGGYAKLDAIADSTKVGNPNMFITGRIPVEGEPDHGKDEHFALPARRQLISTWPSIL